MNKKIALLVGVGIIFLGSALYGNEIEVIKLEKKEVVVPKDPLIAGLLSMQQPGLGQIYCRRYLRGAGFIAGEVCCFVLAAAMAGIETKVYTYTVIDDEGKNHEITQKETISKWDDLSGGERAGVMGLILAGVGIHIWNVIDAYRLAQKHNEERLGWIRDVDVQLGFRENDPSLKVAVSTKF